MIPFVAGVLSGMAIQKVLGGASSEESLPNFEPVQMREVSEEHVKETLAKANKPLREVSEEDLPDYIREKLAVEFK